MGAKCCMGKTRYPHLFEPIRIGNLRLKNRIIAAPTSPSMITAEGHMTPEMCAYLEEKAKGGAAVVTYERQSFILQQENHITNSFSWIHLV